MDKWSYLRTYFRQQYECNMPDIFCAPAALLSLLFTQKVSQKQTAVEHPLRSASQYSTSNMQNSTVPTLKNRLSSLRPVDQLVTLSPAKNETDSSVTPSDINNKRSALAALFRQGCSHCHLAHTRNSFVFGAGNAEAPVMIIGEAPGEDEDDQGLPFVGKAGELLTSMLAAINIDRKNDIFITNILKCRPPENRDPETSEIITCLPLLKKQIDIIKPRAILLLGRIAAHALLNINQSISRMRTHLYDYEGIPCMVIYHPAALLRNTGYKRPTWEDLKQFQTLLATSGIYGTLGKE